LGRGKKGGIVDLVEEEGAFLPRTEEKQTRKKNRGDVMEGSVGVGNECTLQESPMIK